MATVGQARDAARDWIARHGPAFAGYRGAYLAGSTCWLPPETILSPGTDTDVMVVGDETPQRGKFIHDGVLLEISLVPWAQIQSPEAILADYHLAPSFQSGAILDDPTGELAPLQRCVSAHYAEPDWVHRRLDMVQDRIVTGLDALRADAPFHQQVMGWIFPAAVTAHLLLVAALRNPTVRKRYVAAKAVLTDYGREDRYPPLLDLIGCASLSRETAQRALRAVAAVFDATSAVISPDSPLPYATDLHPESRPIAIDGMQELIDTGLHREAGFWLVVTYTRCLTTLAADAPAQLPRWSPGLVALTGELGITSFTDLHARARVAKAQVPAWRALADEIVGRNPEIASTGEPTPAQHGRPGRAD